MAYRQGEEEGLEAPVKPTFELVADCTQPPDKMCFSIMAAKPQRLPSGPRDCQLASGAQPLSHIRVQSLGEPRQSWVISSRPCPEGASCPAPQPDRPC